MASAFETASAAPLLRVPGSAVRPRHPVTRGSGLGSSISQSTIPTQHLGVRVLDPTFPSCTTSEPTPLAEANVSYAPYVHVRTGERALVPVRRLISGAIVAVHPPPPEFIMEQTTFCATPLPPRAPGLCELLLRLIGCGHRDHVADGGDRGVLAVDSPSPVPPEVVRRLQFDATVADPAQGESTITLTYKTLSGLMTSLELPTIGNYITDIIAALGRVDTSSYTLATSVDWRALMVNEWAVKANKRIAIAIDASLNPMAPNVLLLKARLREAESTEHPGILFSGMDILEDIRALVTHRSLGEIKLTADTSALVVFSIGASLGETRLKAEAIKQNFMLKTDLERNVPNAFLHELLSKVPGSNDPMLLMQKARYEDDLYKAEITGTGAPWSAQQLIDYIAVDLARAKPVKAVANVSTKEVANVSTRPPPVLTASTRCFGCGAVGKHMSRDCPIKCGTCNFNFCPGARGEACAVSFDERPSMRSLTNIDDQPMIKLLVDKLDAAWKVKHPNEVSMLEIDLGLSCSSCSDEDSE